MALREVRAYPHRRRSFASSKARAHVARAHVIRARGHAEEAVKGRDGDRIKAVLAAAGYNLTLLLRWFEELLRVLLLIICRGARRDSCLASLAIGNILHGRRARQHYFWPHLFSTNTVQSHSPTLAFRENALALHRTR